jgi:uncharacterized protein
MYKKMNTALAECMIRIIRFYQRMAPTWMRGLCRYTPSCSDYAIMVIRKRGPVVGFLFATLRLLRCVPPFGGVDWPPSVNRK